MHLGWSRNKPGYVLEVLEGPRKGKIITTTMVKFREDAFPMHCKTLVPSSDDSTYVWDDIDLPADDDDPPDVPTDDDSDPDAVQTDDGGAVGGDDDDDDDNDSNNDDHGPPPAPPDPKRYSTRATTDLGDWRPIVRGLDQAIRQA